MLEGPEGLVLVETEKGAEGRDWVAKVAAAVEA